MSRSCYSSFCRYPVEFAVTRQYLLLLAGLPLAVVLSGCGMGTSLPVSAPVTTPQVSAPFSGGVHGGQQPVSSAVMQLYAVSSAGDGASATPLVSRVVTTNASGQFSFTAADVTCPSSSTSVYLTATGGNPGYPGQANNPGIALMAELGPCGSLGSLPSLNVNEVTTVGALAALFPFANGYASIGSQTSDAGLFGSSIASANAYTSISSGTAPGPALGAGLYASSNEIYALANSVAACINSLGGVANDGSACGALYKLATPPGGAAPTDTIGAIVNILKNPTQNVAAIFNLAGTQSPFPQTLRSAPAEWVLPIVSTSNPVINLTVTGVSSVNLGQSAQYSASVSGTTNQSVVWQVNGTTGGNSIYGTISPSGLYTPPASVPTANTLTIAALSLASTTAAAAQPVSLLNPVPIISTAAGSANGYGQSFLVDVQGTGFVNGALLMVNGVPVSTSAVSLTDLQTTVVNKTGASQQITVAVANPSPGATQSTSSSVALTLPSASATAAARFLDQTSYGPTATSIAHVQQIGLLAALTEQFNTAPTLFTQPATAPTECSTANFRCTQSDWLVIATTANDQLRQRMSLALNELWVAPIQSNNAIPFYMNTMATDAFTNYRTIMQDLALAPQMGNYLNMVNSGVAPAGQIPNENFGREVMQLFTLGLNALNPDGSVQLDSNNNPILSYTETQVQAFAKAFTGWTYANADGSTPTAFNGTANWSHAMVAVEARHDTTAKVLLSTTLPSGGTAEVDLKGALDNIFAQPTIAPFIAKTLIQHLVSGNPSPAYVQRVSAVFTNNGNNVRGDMQAVLTAILLDPEARAQDAQTGDQLESSPANQDGHLREPLLFVPNILRGLNATQTNPAEPYPYVNLTSNGLNSLGEQPFNQSSVFNYFSPAYTIPSSTINAPEFQLENTGTVIPRLTLTDSLIHSSSSYGVSVDLSATGVLGSKASTPGTLVDYLGMVFMHSQMPSDMRKLIVDEITNNIPATNPTEQAAVAVYLVVTSNQYKILH